MTDSNTDARAKSPDTPTFDNPEHTITGLLRRIDNLEHELLASKTTHMDSLKAAEEMAEQYELGVAGLRKEIDRLKAVIADAKITAEATANGLRSEISRLKIELTNAARRAGRES